MRRRLGMLGLLALLACQVAPVAEARAPVAGALDPPVNAAAFEPAKTYALMIGLLEWQDPELDTFPQKNRQDRVLEQTLLARGVPRDHVVFLEDRQATLAAIRTALARLLSRAGPGSTVLIYFDGHGIRDYGKAFWANYDIDLEHQEQTGFALAELRDSLIKGWKAERLLLLADCCYSGSLAEVVEQVGQKGIPAACLSSVSPTDGSTERWTFTEALIRAWQGDQRLDGNHDGAITFAETDSFVHDQMKYGEDQLTQGARAGGFEADWRVSAAVSPALSSSVAVQGQWQVGAYAECRRKQTWERAQLLALNADGAFVDYLTKEDRRNEWVTYARLRPIPLTTFAPGQRVKVEYDGDWYSAKIQKSAESFFQFVSYDDLEDADEWVTDRRLRTINFAVPLPGEKAKSK